MAPPIPTAVAAHAHVAALGQRALRRLLRHAAQARPQGYRAYQRRGGECPHDVHPGTDPATDSPRRRQVVARASPSRVYRVHEQGHDVYVGGRDHQVPRSVVRGPRQHLRGESLREVEDEHDDGPHAHRAIVRVHLAVPRFAETEKKDRLNTQGREHELQRQPFNRRGEDDAHAADCRRRCWGRWRHPLYATSCRAFLVALLLLRSLYDTVPAAGPRPNDFHDLYV
mmetsp:Transcript_10619/g.17004  ORF Transcript_10619/g.17004 Transcript_10619/m.17004 type:complete len:226 (-) Transcript_10619:52-729(-)